MTHLRRRPIIADYAGKMAIKEEEMEEGWKF